MKQKNTNRRLRKTLINTAVVVPTLAFVVGAAWVGMGNEVDFKEQGRQKICYSEGHDTSIGSGDMFCRDVVTNDAYGNKRLVRPLGVSIIDASNAKDFEGNCEYPFAPDPDGSCYDDRSSGGPSDGGSSSGDPYNPRGVDRELKLK